MFFCFCWLRELDCVKQIRGILLTTWFENLNHAYEIHVNNSLKEIFCNFTFSFFFTTGKIKIVWDLEKKKIGNTIKEC
jgi:hypothetical protein